MVEGSLYCRKVKDGALVCAVGVEEFGYDDASVGLYLGFDKSGDSLFVFEGGIGVEEHDVVTFGHSDALVVGNGKAGVVVVEDEYSVGVGCFDLFDCVIGGGIVDDDDFEGVGAVVVDGFDGGEGERGGVEGDYYKGNERGVHRIDYTARSCNICMK